MSEIESVNEVTDGTNVVNEVRDENENDRVNYEVVFFVKYNQNPRPSSEELTALFNNYGVVHHINCPENRNFAFIFMTSLNTEVEHRRTRTTICKIIQDMTPETRFHITVANSNYNRFNQRPFNRYNNRGYRNNYDDNYRGYRNNNYSDNYGGQGNYGGQRENYKPPYQTRDTYQRDTFRQPPRDATYDQRDNYNAESYTYKPPYQFGQRDSYSRRPYQDQPYVSNQETRYTGQRYDQRDNKSGPQQPGVPAQPITREIPPESRYRIAARQS